MDKQGGHPAAGAPRGATIIERTIPLVADPQMATVPGPRVFRSLIRAGAANPAARASVLVDPYHECPYPEIVPSMEAVQRYLLEQGLTPGDCVTAELSHSVCSAIIVLALFDAGYSVVLEQAPASAARAGAAAAPAMRFSKAFVSVRTDVKPQSAVLSRPSSYVQVRVNPEYDPAARGPRRDQPRLYTRTSGSLGASKIVARPYEHYRLSFLNLARSLRYEPSMRMALPTPIYHLFGLGSGLLLSVYSGVSIDFQERANVLRYLEREEMFNPNIAVVVPTFCESLTRARRSPRPYRFMIIGGDTTSDTTRRKSESLHGPLINQYGSSEMGAIATMDRDTPPELRARSACRLMPGVTLRLLVPADQTNSPAPVGELQLKTAYQFEEYVDRDGRHVDIPSAFDGEWFRTGDLARLGENDTLEVLGRSDLSVNRNGLLLPFADVEARLLEVDGVAEAGVAAGPEGIRGRALVAFVVLSGHASLTPREVRDRYAARAPAYSVPDAVQILETIPKLPSGKIDRRALSRLSEMATSSG